MDRFCAMRSQCGRGRRDGVVAAGGEGVAAQEPPGGERCAAQEAVRAQGVGGVAGACGVEAASGAWAGERVQQRGEGVLVDFYEEQKGGGEEGAFCVFM